MTDGKYRILFKGEILNGAALPEVKEKLAAAYKTDLQKIESLFSGKLKIIKKNAALEVCQKTQKVFQQAGAKCYIKAEKQDVNAADSDPPAPPIPSPASEPKLQTAPQINPNHGNLPTRHCGTCGSRIPAAAVICPECGTKPKQPVSKTALLLLAFFLGGLGAHKFYIGRHIQGVLYLLFCWTLIPGIIALVEFIIYAITSEKDLQRKYEATGHIAIIVVALGGCIMVGVAMIGILAAIAIPNFIAYRNKAYKSSVESELVKLQEAQEYYYTEHRRYTADMEELEFFPTVSSVTIEITAADENCFEAVGSRPELAEDIYIDCEGLKNP
jgi:TM2 domain-containing membrane protein YozV